MSKREVPSTPCESQKKAFETLGFESEPTGEPSFASWKRHGLLISVSADTAFTLQEAVSLSLRGEGERTKRATPRHGGRMGPIRTPLARMKCIASSFADPADVAAFKKCKARGKSDDECFKVGDNGVGCWGDNTAQDKHAMCALPPDDMIQKFGTVTAARHHSVLVSFKKKTCVCILADRMPWKKNIKNGAGIDLNPAAIAQLGIPRGAMVKVEWRWQ